MDAQVLKCARLLHDAGTFVAALRAEADNEFAFLALVAVIQALQEESGAPLDAIADAIAEVVLMKGGAVR